MKLGSKVVSHYDLSSLRLLGSVGEPINPEAWIWYRDVIGSGKTPVVDTWWQTETGAIMISPLPGITASKPGPTGLDSQAATSQVMEQNSMTMATCGYWAE